MADDSTPAKNPRPIHLIISIAAIMIAFVALLISGLNWYMTFHIERQRPWQQLQAKVDNLQTQTTSSHEQLQQQLLSQRQKISHVQTYLQRLSHYSDGGSTQRAISETAYLVHLAHLYLTISNNTKMAQNLLERANKNLSSLTGSAIDTVKQQLQHEILQLQQIKPIDINELIQRLDTTIQNVLKLHSAGNSKFTPETAPVINQNLSWYQRLKLKLYSLKNLVIIRHVDDSALPALLPHQEAYLKQIIQTKLLQAQWAVFHGNSALYHHSLASAAGLLHQYFLKNPQTKNIIDEINHLLAVTIKPDTKEILTSLQTLEHHLGSLLTLPALDRPTPHNSKQQE